MSWGSPVSKVTLCVQILKWQWQTSGSWNDFFFKQRYWCVKYMENKGNEAVLTFSQYSIQIQEIQRFKTCWQCNKIQKISSKKLENWKSSQIAKSFKIFVDFWRLKNSFRARCTYLNLWESNTFKFQQLWLNEGKFGIKTFYIFVQTEDRRRSVGESCEKKCSA